jgi:DNA-binding CsgD family transcriptional regulator
MSSSVIEASSLCLTDILRAMTTNDLSEVPSVITQKAGQLWKGSLIRINRITSSGSCLEPVATYGDNHTTLGARLPINSLFESFAVQANRNIRFRGTEQRRPPGASAILASPYKSAMIELLRWQNKVIGTFTVAKMQAWNFTVADEARLKDLACCASLSLMRPSIATETKTLVRSEASTSKKYRPGRDSEGVSAAGFSRASTRRDSYTVAKHQGAGHVTTRDAQIINLLAKGMRFKEVAAVLLISTRTVEHHIERLKQRFGARSLPSLVGQLTAARLVDPADHLCLAPLGSVTALSYERIDGVALGSDPTMAQQPSEPTSVRKAV